MLHPNRYDLSCPGCAQPRLIGAHLFLIGVLQKRLGHALGIDARGHKEMAFITQNTAIEKENNMTLHA